MSTALPLPAIANAPPSELDAVYRKIFVRLLPFLMVMWILAWIDRVNIGFVKLTMLDDLKWSEAIYGLGAGIFFLGYFSSRYRATCCCRRSVRARRSCASPSGGASRASS